MVLVCDYTFSVMAVALVCSSLGWGVPVHTFPYPELRVPCVVEKKLLRCGEWDENIYDRWISCEYFICEYVSMSVICECFSIFLMCFMC